PISSWRPSPKTVRALAIAATLVYVIGMSWFILRQGGWPTPDFLIPPLILVAIIYGRGWSFLVDWLPFLLLLLAYESFRGIADDLNSRVAIQELVDAERWLMGGIPTNELQARFFDRNNLAWYDWGATLLHVAHFGVPVAMGFAIWLNNRALYWRFAGSVVGLCFAGFVIHYLYPAAPPWMAADMGLIPHVDRVIGHTTSSMATGSGISLAYQEMSPNDVAAMPSLHAAMPVLIFMIVISMKGWRWSPLILYPIVGGVAWVYIGEHYAIDVFAGYALAVVAYGLFWVLAA